jgi:hypothetical protein
MNEQVVASGNEVATRTMGLETAVMEANREMVTGVGVNEAGGIVVEMDVRKADWSRRLGLPSGREVYWASVRQIQIREASVLGRSIEYKVTYGNGWYREDGGKKVYFGLQQYLKEIDLESRCTWTAMRAAVMLSVLAGIGVRCVGKLMDQLFMCQVSKSAIDRWVTKEAEELPDAEGFCKMLNEMKKVEEGNIDEIFRIGKRPKICTVVIRDEHGRILIAREMEEKTTDNIVKLLRDLKSWGIEFKRFYMDGCEEYKDAVRIVYPEATIQYDYFHIIQCIWKKLRKEMTQRRRRIKELGEEGKKQGEPWWRSWKELAQRVWENRGLILKKPERLTAEEKERIESLEQEESVVLRVREFTKAIWDLFEKSQTEEEAKEKLKKLRERPEVQKGSQYMKAVEFLEGRFDDMVTYLRQPGVSRNSLSETGMRCMRRLDRGHDGFRGAAGLDRYLRLYQAIKYCNWTVHSRNNAWKMKIPSQSSFDNEPLADINLS